MTLTQKIFIGMIAGIALGAIANGLLPLLPAQLASSLNSLLFNGLFDIVGEIFVRSLKVLVVPMVLVSLVCGTATLGGHGRMGIMAGKTIGLYMVSTALAISLALSLAVMVKPGEGVAQVSDASFEATEPPSLKDTLVAIFPNNPVEAMAEGNMLQVIVFAVLLGIALSRSGATGTAALELFTSLNTVIMEMVMILMRLAPYGVFCLLAKIFAETGFGLILQLGLYFGTVVAALLLHALVVYSTLLRLFTGLSPATTFSKLRPVMMFAFSTASSNATMPVTLETVRDKLGVNNSIASFTVPLGATINMDGTAIMQGVATVFIAQAYGIDIGVAGFLTVVLTATLASIGTAGVPGVGLIMLAMVLEQVGLPVEGIALVIGVDRLLDMLRTAVNVTGDSVVTTIIADTEGSLDREVFHSDTSIR